MAIPFGVSEVRTSSGERIELEPDGILVLVGPNNSGKSLLLRELQASLNSGGVGQIVAETRVTQTGTEDEWLGWLEAHADRRRVPGHAEDSYVGLEFGVTISSARTAWRQGNPHRVLPQLFCHLANADARIAAANQVRSINVTAEEPSHPLHILYSNDTEEKRLSTFFESAFGESLVVDRSAGAVVLLRVGQRPDVVPPEDRQSTSFVRKIQALSLLQKQGDGMRSFVGCMLAATLDTRFVVLLDEPEAFLHPPQAFQLGRLLAKEKKPGVQLILATHSNDVLRGLLDTNDTSVRVARITRSDAGNEFSVLPPARVRELWSDPILKFSNILDGLFHRSAVLCEGDADCRFYAAMLSVLTDARGTQVPDTMFAWTGGKQRLPKVAAALRHLGVTTRAVVDFDALREEQPLRGLFEALGGAWDEIKDRWEYLRQSVVAKAPPLSLAQVKQEIENVLSQAKGTALTEPDAVRIKGVLKATSAWSALKLSGLAGLPGGQPTQTAKELVEALQVKGLFVVPVGELERFVPSIGNHGPDWVGEALDRDLANDPELEAARGFVRGLAASIE